MMNYCEENLRCRLLLGNSDNVILTVPKIPRKNVIVSDSRYDVLCIKNLLNGSSDVTSQFLQLSFTTFI